MHYFLLIYCNNKSLHVSSSLTANHQEDQLYINSNLSSHAFMLTGCCQKVVNTMHDYTTMLPATSSVHYTTNCNTESSAPEDGQNNFPKHVELTGIINKPLLLHLVGCLYYLYQ